MYITTDYAGSIEAMKAGNCQGATVGAAGYAAAYDVLKGDVFPFAVQSDEKGGIGYYSIIIISAKSPYKKIEDLKGKTFAWGEPNSTSGFLAPNYYLKKQGFDPDKFFSKSGEVMREKTVDEIRKSVNRFGPKNVARFDAWFEAFS